MRLARTAALAAGPLVLAAVLIPAGTASAAGSAVRAPGHLTPVVAETSTAATVVDEAATLAPSSTAATATFTVTYNGFTPAAKASFQRAVNTWANNVKSSVPITVQANFKPLATGVLGSAGPNFIWRDFTGAPKPGTFYVDAVANKRAGRQLDPSPDIVANFSSSYSNWSFATGPAPRGKYDFQSVVTHELGHGLGFLGAGVVANGKGSVRLATSAGAFPTAYDRFTETGAGKALLTFPNNSATLAAALKGNNIFFDSPAVRSANGGKTAKLYAPATWQQGSSYSHLDDATYPAGNANSLMTHAIGDGETVRTPGPIVKAVFASTGW